MSWSINESEGVVIVKMTSNSVNKMNLDFFEDLQETFELLERDFRGIPVVLTAPGNVFSVGIDFEYSFSLFEKEDPSAVTEWFEKFRGAILRVFKFPGLIVAAINGHTFAGGMILALCCDFRIGVEGKSKLGINEVPVGIPMPSVYTEIIREKLGSAVAMETILTGKIYSIEESLNLGIIQKIVKPTDLISEATRIAKCIPLNCMEAYIHSKKMLLYPTLERIKKYSEDLDLETAKVICSPGLIAAQKTALLNLKNKK